MAAPSIMQNIETAVGQLGIEEAVELTPGTQFSPVPNNHLDSQTLETKSLEIFKDLIKDAGLDDYNMMDAMLKRWLLAQAGDPIKAATMLKENLEWRRMNDMDSILKWVPPTHLPHDFPFQLCGLDKDGDLFGVVTWRKMDVDGALRAIHEGRVHEEYLRYLYKSLEVVHRIYRENSTTERPCYQGTVIIDLEGFSAYQFASRDVVEIVLEVVRRYEASYPNMLKHAIVVNTPTVFTVLWNLMKPFLSEYTLSRVQIFGWVGQDWKSVLRKLCPAQELPSHVGGANTTCKNYEATDGYSNLQPPTLPNFPKDSMTLAYVPACQKLTIDIQVDTPGSTLSWGFQTDYYDIGFAVLNAAKEEIVHDYRVDAHILQQKGFIVCKTAGKYHLVFDNSFSNYRAKTVYYVTKITNP